ncbi:HAD-IIA family hydrolase [Halorientalis salina]|uniref:HAD-IIA family hydrolase n=1 Tax=Halorientalis salina TaxID=2932266 RepID=UPI0010AD44F1|nr:HAD-IIA family hydrolase [Halorientalis salina]
MSYRGVVLDLDGTVYRGSDPLPGAVDAIDSLRAADLSVLFFSNNPTETRLDYVDRLGEMGIAVDVEEVLSAGTVTTDYLTDEHADDDLFLIGSPALREQFETAGLTLTEDATAADVLVASWDREFDYGSMTAGLRGLQDEDTVFVGSDPDRVVPAGEDSLIPGSGAIIGAIEAAADRAVDRVMGKPSPEAVEAATDALGVPPEDCLLVGDRLDTDIALGERAGMTTVLVLTGITDRSDVEESEFTPDHVMESLADVPALLE